MNILLCKLNNKLGTYEKHGVSEIVFVDNKYGKLLEEFLMLEGWEQKKSLWIGLCDYLIDLLGNIDVRIYEKVDKL